jgi:hypothetical protein
MFPALVESIDVECVNVNDVILRLCVMLMGPSVGAEWIFKWDIGA